MQHQPPKSRNCESIERGEERKTKLLTSLNIDFSQYRLHRYFIKMMKGHHVAQRTRAYIFHFCIKSVLYIYLNQKSSQYSIT